MRFLDFSAPSGKCQASGCTFPKRAAAAARDQAALHSSAAAGRLHRSRVQGTVVPPRHRERSAPVAVLSGIRPRFARRFNRAFRGWKRSDAAHYRISHLKRKRDKRLLAWFVSEEDDSEDGED